MAKYIFETTPKRSKNMSKIRSKDTKPEILFRKALWALGIRYRINVTKLPGKPDIVIEKKKTIIFIDGEFWHGYKWDEKKQKIRSNRDYWINKIEKNISRDIENTQRLQDLGYNVFRFWGHEVIKDLPNCVSKIINY
ncbi:very short patch repair endonuclease [Chryseobacterium phocaeense]|uniref:very short patch repair endonuclease n=1 Tax=Chryseobacterium phocaeense TaxID=1816690 RepID=UPI0009BB8CC9|nr:very short patch repair endonuclease [Chryseobacterium phocaeense]